MNVNDIIKEELQVLNEQDIYTIPDLIKMLERKGFDSESQKYLQELLFDAYREDGDMGVINKYKEMTGVDIQAISRGKYSFANIYSPVQYKEGVGDKYAEKKFGIPDETQTNVGLRTNDMGEFVGFTTSDYEDSKLSAVFLNPLSLKNFEKDVRAVSDMQGNLYVAQIDGNFVHAGFNNVINGIANNSRKFITWMRLGNTNRFAYSDSFMAYAQQTKHREDIENRLNVLRQKHPNMEFIPKFYYFADDF